MANKKITELTALTDPDANDLLAIVDDPSGTPVTKQITATKLVKSLNNQAATFVVAASHSLHKEHADYVCDGVDDQVEIQAAIDALTTAGGTIVLLEGSFTISASINWPAKKGIRLVGTSTGESADSTIVLADDSNCSMIVFNQPDNIISQVEISGLRFDGNKSHQTSGHIFDATLCIHDSWFFRLRMNNAYGDALHFGDADHKSWNIFISDSYFETCGNAGIYIYGNETDLSKNFFISNCYTHGNKYGIHATYMRESRICGCGIGDSKEANVALHGCNNVTFGNCTFVAILSDNYDCITLEDINGNKCERIIISDCVIGDDAPSPKARYGVYLKPNTKYVQIVNCNFNGLLSEAIKDASNNITNIYSSQHSDLFMDVLAVSATHVRENENLSEGIPNTFTIDAQPDVPRTLSGHFDSHAQITAYTIVITGTDAKGNTITETFTEAASPWDFETVNAYATITSIIMTTRTGTGAGDTMDIGITDVLGLSNIIYETGDVFKIKKNNANAVVAAAQVNTTYDTHDMSVIGLGAGDDFTIWYKSNLNILS